MRSTAKNALKKVTRTGTRASIEAAARAPGGDRLLARVAASASEDFLSHTASLLTGKKRRGGRRVRLGHEILSNSVHDAVKLAELATSQGIEIPAFYERVASRAERDGDLDSAIRLRREALSLDASAHRYIALAFTLDRQRESTVVHDWILGLSWGQSHKPNDESIALLEMAYRLESGNAFVLHAYGSALVKVGQPDLGTELLEMAVLKSPRDAWVSELAELYRRPDIARFERSMSNYERLFNKDPKNMKALAGIVNAGTRGPMDWTRIWRSVRQLETRKQKSPTPYSQDEVASLLDRLFWAGESMQSSDIEHLVRLISEESNRDCNLHPTVVGLIVLRLQFLRYFELGFRLRRKAATLKSQSLRKSPIRTANQLRGLMKSLVYIDDAAIAARLAKPEFWPESDQTQRQQIRKMHADALLMTGDAGEYIAYSNEVRRDMPLPADDKMEKLIRGKRVALVGPADTGDRLGSAIDEFDVVVRPRYQPDFIARNRDAQGSRTDVTYYSGQDMTTLLEEISGAAERGEVKVVNARPFSYEAHAHRKLPWMRFYRQDFSLSFHGGSLGIQRIAYDLLQFEPKEICIFNSDFYTGSSMFTPGWREGDSFGPYSHINDIVVSHDIKSEFKFTQSLMKTGIVKARGRAAEVLALTPDEYVESVESAGVLK